MYIFVYMCVYIYINSHNLKSVKDSVKKLQETLRVSEMEPLKSFCFL